MSYPKVVALDTDWTIWERFLDHTTWGKGQGAHATVEDNIERVDRWLLQDRTNHAISIRVFDDISNIVNDILKNGAQLAIVSRNTSKAMCDRALYYFNTINPSDEKEWSIIHLVKYDEVVDESKVEPFRRIRTWSGNDFLEMLMFDDEAFNNVVRIELGTTFQFVRDRKGLTWDTYQQGLNAWRRAKNIMIPSNIGTVSNRVLIGYTGLNAFWIDLVQRREGIVDTKTPYRWGYALYVTDMFGIAKTYCDWERTLGRTSNVCAVWVKDYDTWMKTNKIWVPENNGYIPQMQNMSWSAEATGRNQEDRDAYIAAQWGVHTPYVLFSRHFWFPPMPIPQGQRWNEMLLYMPIVRSLIELIPLSDAEAAQNTNPSPYPYHRQMKTWNITVPNETRQEFLRYGETELYQLSA